jgi:hypothetical protein
MDKSKVILIAACDAALLGMPRARPGPLGDRRDVLSAQHDPACKVPLTSPNQQERGGGARQVLAGN